MCNNRTSERTFFPLTIQTDLELCTIHIYEIFMLPSWLLFACLENKRNSNIIKVHHKVGPKGPEGEYMYISTLSLTSALDEGEWPTQRHALAALRPGNTQYPLYRRLGGPPGLVWTGAENLTPHWDLIPVPSSP